MSSLFDLITSSKFTIVLTGAGISTLSGIADFRGKNGFYKRQDIDTEKFFDLAYFKRDPDYFYANGQDFIYGLASKEANIVHKVLAKLEQKALIKAVLTQNIDLLHQKAGTKKLLELHGSPSVHSCMNCQAKFSYDEIVKKLELTPNKAPKCLKCGGIIKPDIIFFGEALNYEVLSEAERLASKADLLIVLGSSLTVYPVAAIPEISLANGAKLVIVNDGQTHFDRQASLRYTSLEEVFTELNNELSD